MKADETKELLKAIKAAYDRFEISQERAKFWHDILKDYEYAALLKNLKRYAATNKYAPTIADLTEGIYQDQSRPYTGGESLSDEEIRQKWGLE